MDGVVLPGVTRPSIPAVLIVDWSKMHALSNQSFLAMNSGRIDIIDARVKPKITRPVLMLERLMQRAPVMRYIARQMPLCQPLQCAMRSFVVILFSPVVNKAPSFLDRAKKSVDQASIAKDTVEALVMAVLPWTARRHDVGLNRRLAQPGGNSLCRERWALVMLHRDRIVTFGKQAHAAPGRHRLRRSTGHRRWPHAHVCLHPLPSGTSAAVHPSLHRGRQHRSKLGSGSLLGLVWSC
jgi:hypothetical protein